MEMIYGHRSDLPVTEVDKSQMKDLVKKVIFSPETGWPGHAMRVMSIAPGGAAYVHSHPYPHYVYYLEGEGKITYDGKTYPAKKGSYIYIPSDVPHGMENVGDTPFEFICCIPVIKEGEY